MTVQIRGTVDTFVVLANLINLRNQSEKWASDLLQVIQVQSFAFFLGKISIVRMYNLDVHTDHHCHWFSKSCRCYRPSCLSPFSVIFFDWRKVGWCRERKPFAQSCSAIHVSLLNLCVNPFFLPFDRPGIWDLSWSKQIACSSMYLDMTLLLHLVRLWASFDVLLLVSSIWKPHLTY